MSLRVVYIDPPSEYRIHTETEAVKRLGGDIYVRTADDDPEKLASDADIILASGEEMTPAMFAEMEKCKAVICFGIGFDHVDTAAATAAGVCVVNHPGFCVDEVSNHTLLLLLTLSRQLHRTDGGMRRGEGWTDEATAVMGDATVIGRTLGIVGLGDIGRHVAKKAAPFGLRVIAADPYVDRTVAQVMDVELMPLDELLAQADFVTTHTPLNKETYHLFGEREFRLMKASAYFINTSRGRVVDEKALLRALDERWIAGAGLDVFEEEPVLEGNPLVGRKDTVVTPHVAFFSERSTAELHNRVAKAIGDISEGRLPYHIANPEVVGRSRIEGR